VIEILCVTIALVLSASLKKSCAKPPFTNRALVEDFRDRERPASHNLSTGNNSVGLRKISLGLHCATALVTCRCGMNSTVTGCILRQYNKVDRLEDDGRTELDGFCRFPSFDSHEGERRQWDYSAATVEPRTPNGEFARRREAAYGIRHCRTLYWS
jgi:hypothetical protein